MVGGHWDSGGGLRRTTANVLSYRSQGYRAPTNRDEITGGWTLKNASNISFGLAQDVL